jgi:mRNA interferase MazF
MPPTISYKRGDILLVPFPFSDQSAAKQQPALVISVDVFQEQGPDLLIMAITSQLGGPLKLGEFLIRDWPSAGLLKPSAVKAAITTIEAKLVRRRLGCLSDHDLKQLETSLCGLLGLAG